MAAVVAIVLLLVAGLLLTAGLAFDRVFLRQPVKVKYYNEPADYLSYGEVEHAPGCKCRPSNVLYWELSPAITDDCPIHGEKA